MNLNVLGKGGVGREQRSAIYFEKFAPCPLNSSCCRWHWPLSIAPWLLLSGNHKVTPRLTNCHCFLLLTGYSRASFSLLVLSSWKRGFFFPDKLFSILFLGPLFCCWVFHPLAGGASRRSWPPLAQSHGLLWVGRGPAGLPYWTETGLLRAA